MLNTDVGNSSFRPPPIDTQLKRASIPEGTKSEEGPSIKKPIAARRYSVVETGAPNVARSYLDHIQAAQTPKTPQPESMLSTGTVKKRVSNIETPPSPTSSSAPLVQVKIIETYSSSLVETVNEKGKTTISSLSPGVGRLPDEAREALKLWYQAHPGKKTCSDEDISKALVTFEKTHKCRWEYLKAGEGDESKVLQVINDLRSAVLAMLFEGISKEYADVLDDISESGSQKLKSDRDFAFVCKKDLVNKQTKEAEIVNAFNTRFREFWLGKAAETTPPTTISESSIIFDANAYTMQELLIAFDPDSEKKRAGLHEDASLLMKRKYLTEAQWESFTKETLNLLPNETDKEKTIKDDKKLQFERVEEQHRELESLLKQEMVKQQLLGQVISPKVDIKKAGESLKAAVTHAHTPSDLESKASGALHVAIKKGERYKTIESNRHELQKDIVKLTTITNAEAFTKEYNDTIKNKLHD